MIYGHISGCVICKSVRLFIHGKFKSAITMSMVFIFAGAVAAPVHGLVPQYNGTSSMHRLICTVAEHHTLVCLISYLF